MDGLVSLPFYIIITELLLFARYSSRCRSLSISPPKLTISSNPSTFLPQAVIVCQLSFSWPISKTNSQMPSTASPLAFPPKPLHPASFLSSTTHSASRTLHLVIMTCSPSGCAGLPSCTANSARGGYSYGHSTVERLGLRPFDQ